MIGRPPGLPPAALLLAGALAAGAAAPALAAPPLGPATGQPPASARDRYAARFVGRPAPDFRLDDLRGVGVRLSSLRGKVVLLNFWYSSCPPCRREIPDLAALHRLHGPKGLEILGINLDDILMPGAGRAPLQAFLAEVRIPYRTLIGDNEIFELYGGVPVQPLSIVVDREGRVARVFWGAYPGPVLEKAILPYLSPPVPRR